MLDDLLQADDLTSNPTPRVPVCLCLDVSGSMVGEPIGELNKGVKLFYDAIKEDERALFAAEVCIVTFGSQGARCLADFAGLQTHPDPPALSAGGLTPMGEAVNQGLDLLDARKEKYKKTGTDYFQPWLVLMTDGAPNGDAGELERAVERTSRMVRDGKLTIFPIGIGSDADMRILARFSPKRSPLKLKGLKFREFFDWLSKSVQKTSQSKPNEKVSLDTDGIKGWGEL